MTTFFDDDGKEDNVGSWSAGDSDAWKGNYGIADQVNDAILLNNTAIKENEADIEFRTNGNKGYGILQSDMLVICDVMDFIIGHIEHRPYFAHKELNNLDKLVDDIENSKYCKFAADQNETLAELAHYRSDIATLRKQAYDKLEW